MKKDTKDSKGLRKLTLSRETLRNLEEEKLQEILGAASNWNSCDTATRFLCGSRLC